MLRIYSEKEVLCTPTITDDAVSRVGCLEPRRAYAKSES
jgi:hypothetical protein